MADLNNLTKAIYGVLEGSVDIPQEKLDALTARLGRTISDRLQRDHGAPTLRLSNLGTNCDRKLWYLVNTPEVGEELDGKTRLKFLYGDLIEQLVLSLADIAGYTISGEQDQVTLEGVVGHRDAIIEGRIFDVKSASPHSFRKFASGELHLGELTKDPFGYVDQIQGYLAASQDDPKVTDKSNASFLVVDKVHGSLYVDTHSRKERDWKTLVDSKRAMLRAGVPDRGFSDIPEGKSGNYKLGLECSYYSFKRECWPGLRLFNYANKPVFLTRVAREPKVAEIKTHDDTLDDF